MNGTLSVNCGNDPLVTYLGTQYDDMLAPKITRIINKLLETGYAQIDLKHAKITSFIQKDNLDKDKLQAS